MRHLNTTRDATHLVEQLNELHIRGMLPEVLLQKPVDRALEEERVVDRDEADALGAVPARLAAAGDARVHHVVRDEEERLELWRGVEREYMW